MSDEPLDEIEAPEDEDILGGHMPMPEEEEPFELDEEDDDVPDFDPENDD